MSSEWPMVKLGDVLTRSNELIPIAPDKCYQQITVKLWGKGVVQRAELLGSEIAAPRQYIVKPHQFILSRIDARNGAFGLIPGSLDGAVVSNDFPVFDLNREVILPEFLEWMSKTHWFVDLCKQASEGTTNRIRLKEETFLAAEIPLPPLDEQRRIVARIDALAERITKARGLRAEAVKKCKALLDGKMSEIFKTDLHNSIISLSDVAILERGRFSFRPRNDPRFFGGIHPWIQIGEIENSEKYIYKWTQTLNDLGMTVSKKFEKGTVLISIAATIGAVGILTFDCCIPDSIVGITPKEFTDSEFIYYYLTFTRKHLEDIAPQSAQKNINLALLSRLPFPKFSYHEQQRIVVYLDALQAKVDAVKALQAETAAELDALLPSVLDKAFRGEL